MAHQYMKIYRCLVYMLDPVEYFLYSYLLDRFNNILDKYNNNIAIEQVHHDEEQKSMANRLHLSLSTLKRTLKSLEAKGFIKIAHCKELGTMNSYYMTDIAETEVYKKLDAKFRYSYQTSAEKRAEQEQDKKKSNATQKKIHIEIEVDEHNRVTNSDDISAFLNNVHGIRLNSTMIYHYCESSERFVKHLEESCGKSNLELVFKYV